MTDKFLEHAEKGRLPAIRSAIENKMDVNSTDKVSSLLVERVIHIILSFPTQYGYSALINASWKGHKDCVNFLLASKANINHQNQVQFIRDSI